MKVLNQIVYNCNKVLKVLGNLVLSVIMITITAGIVSRYVFNRPFAWTEELATFMMVNLGFISAAIVTISKKHIVADFFIAKAPEKFRKAVSFFSRILQLVFFTVISFSVYKLLPMLVYKSPALGIPRSAYYIPVVAMCGVMFFVVVVDLLNDFFPGYDLIAEEERKIAEQEKEAEVQEAAEIQKSVESFLGEEPGSKP